MTLAEKERRTKQLPLDPITFALSRFCLNISISFRDVSPKYLLDTKVHLHLIHYCSLSSPLAVGPALMALVHLSLYPELKTSIASEGILANLLADAEGPAHEKWSDKTDKFRQNYPGSKGGQILTFLRKAPSEMIFKIRGNASQKDSTAFANFFPLPGDPKLGSAGKNEPVKTGEGVRPKEPIKPEIVRNEHKFQIDSSTNGFSIKSTLDNTTLIGKEIEALVAYKVRSGDSFSKWQVEDFDLTKIKPKLEGCTITKCEGNSASIYITGRKFKAIWNGFDQIRDLDIKANLKDSKE
jgi:hypothetical protein